MAGIGTNKRNNHKYGLKYGGHLQASRSCPPTLWNACLATASSRVSRWTWSEQMVPASRPQAASQLDPSPPNVHWRPAGLAGEVAASPEPSVQWKWAIAETGCWADAATTAKAMTHPVIIIATITPSKL